MIGNLIHLPLNGLHKRAFHIFCDRIRARNTKDGAEKLVEQLPEFQYLSNLRVVDNTDNNTNENVSQA